MFRIEAVLDAPGQRRDAALLRLEDVDALPYRFAATDQRGVTADSLDAIIGELEASTQSERQHRVIDHDAASSMEMKNQEGYF